MKTKSIVICGVGGQGIITASDLLSDALMEAGLDVKKSEVHGMSQRGGDVISTVRYGKEVFSPLPAQNEVDIMLSFEKLEALRNVNYLRPDAYALVNDFELLPLPVASGYEKYPGDIREQLGRFTKNLVMIPASDIASGLGNIRAANIVLVGLLASKMEFEAELWKKVISRKIKPQFLDLNLQAFDAGFSYGGR
jgi:indolepyruvate ferredoxin oxidoreductase beta subunit